MMKWKVIKQDNQYWLTDGIDAALATQSEIDLWEQLVETEEELNAELAMKRVYIQQITTLDAQLAEARCLLQQVVDDATPSGGSMRIDYEVYESVCFHLGLISESSET